MRPRLAIFTGHEQDGDDPREEGAVECPDRRNRRYQLGELAGVSGADVAPLEVNRDSVEITHSRRLGAPLSRA
jgi:hypothetical protein